MDRILHRPRRARLALLGAVLTALFATAAPAAAATYPPDFEEQELVTGLTRPMAAAWAPDGRMFVVEKDGLLKVVNEGSQTAIQIGDYRNQVNSQHDRGLLGVAVDGQFATNPFVYLLYTYDLQPAIADSDGPMVSQLLRVRVNANNQVSDPTPILGTRTSGVCPPPANNVDCLPSDGLSHSIGTVRSAPDGTLWLGSGDAASFSTVDPTALRTYNEQSLAGKIIHVNRNGQGVPGHPFCAGNGLADVCTKLHAKGFRNPFRFTLRPSGGLVVGDVGWNEREEVDLVPATGGQSFGWPCYEGNIQTPGYKDLDECKAEYARGPGAHRPPVSDYPHGGMSRSVMGGPEYDGLRYPGAYRNSIFYADYSGGFINRLVPGAGGTYASQPFASDWGGVALEEAPDGDLVVVDPGSFGDAEGAVRRIAYSPGNRTPTARISASPTSGAAPLTVSFDARSSTDPDGDPLTYSWNFGDGQTGTGPTPTHTYGPGDRTAVLTVDDGGGRTDTAEVRVSSDNTLPALTIRGDTSYRGGAPIRLSASGSDAEDGPLPATAFDWDVKLYHADHIHPITTYANRANIELDAITDHDADAYYEVIVTATDSRGATTRSTARLRPQTTAFRLDSSPPGAPLSYGGRAFSAPRDLTSAIGFLTSVSAAQSFTTGGSTYVFERWSDGGARVHDIRIPAGASGLIAVYRDTSPGAPAPPGGQAPSGSDEQGPKLRLLELSARRGRVRGSASDPSGIERVAVALRSRSGAKDCAWWLSRRKAMSGANRSCKRPAWIKARLVRAAGGVRFGVRLGRPVPPGRYRVIVKAVDRAGNATKLASGRSTVLRVARD